MDVTRRLRGLLLFITIATVAPVPAAEPLPAGDREPPAEAARTPSGVAWVTVGEGREGAAPGAEDQVKVRFTGWDAAGEVIESTDRVGKAVVVPFARALPGWREGLAGIRPGETRRLWMPAELANREGEGTVVFDVTVEEVLSPPVAPPDVAAPPEGAERSRSGLAWRVLAPGSGEESPGRRSRVRVHYSGWTTDGQLFDSSRLRGEPATFPLDRVIPGWTEGLRLMVEGERRLFWIPEKLAYEGVEGKPAGMLVFDVELLEILD